MQDDFSTQQKVGWAKRGPEVWAYNADLISDAIRREWYSPVDAVLFIWALWGYRDIFGGCRELYLEWRVAPLSERIAFIRDRR